MDPIHRHVLFILVSTYDLLAHRIALSGLRLLCLSRLLRRRDESGAILHRPFDLDDSVPCMSPREDKKRQAKKKVRIIVLTRIPYKGKHE